MYIEAKLGENVFTMFATAEQSMKLSHGYFFALLIGVANPHN